MWPLTTAASPRTAATIVSVSFMIVGRRDVDFESEKAMRDVGVYSKKERDLWWLSNTANDCFFFL